MSYSMLYKGKNAILKVNEVNVYVYIQKNTHSISERK